MNDALHILVAEGIPLAPPLMVRLIALLVVEAVLLTLVVLLYVRWVQFKNQPLDKWWAERKADGLAPSTLLEIEASERERLAAEEAAAAQPQPAANGDARSA
jgi:hypothetical protein